MSGSRAGGDLYVPVASAAFVERHPPDGFTADAVAAAPRWRGIATIALQDQLVRTVFARTLSDRHYYVPTAEGFDAAVRAGLVGMFPDQLVDPGLTQVTDHHLDVPLFRQCWKLDSPTVAAVTEAIKSAATAS